ncbi:tumor necrosis factor ligand superfamily member 4 isoform X2 [Rhinatrema bivittatum]|uniref:tumor necrosis factor ligand superfamily member 4 isoform X2 n=1 Tax=Rhinatrema bivittatum TaxID=194408 RepID=UPI00112B5198|nr:tumor necrosis factor ligand superfamily member 4 isoform X2 [Rhinatrema bivittatum]
MLPGHPSSCLSHVAEELSTRSPECGVIAPVWEEDSDKEKTHYIKTDMNGPLNFFNNESRVVLIHRSGNMNLKSNNSIIVSKDGFYMVQVKGKLSKTTIPVTVKVYYRRANENSSLMLELRGNDTLKENIMESLMTDDYVFMTASTDEETSNIFSSLSLHLILISSVR